jgi:hypothetical protein
LKGHDSWQPEDALHRKGVFDFELDQIKPGAGFGVPVKDALLNCLLRIPPTRPSRLLSHSFIRSPRRYLRQHLPETDFAYVWDDIHIRRLCVSRSAKEFILCSGFASENEFEPVEIIDAVPEGVELLDGTCPCPPPVSIKRNLIEQKELVRIAWAEFIAHPKPMRRPNLSRALRMLRDAKRRRPEDFCDPAKGADIQRVSRELPHPLPAAWQSILKISDGCFRLEAEPTDDIDNVTLLGTETLVAEHKEWQKICEEWREAEEITGLPASLLRVGSVTSEGDFLALDVGKINEKGDCPVLWISHESFESTREWPSIAAFLEAALGDGS